MQGLVGMELYHYKSAVQPKTSKGIFYPPVKPLCIGREVIIITPRILSQLSFTYQLKSPVAVREMHILLLEK